MKELLIERITAIEAKRIAEKRSPCYPTELDLRKDIAELVTISLDLLIKEGSITVAGKTINKDRLLAVKK